MTVTQGYLNEEDEIRHLGAQIARLRADKAELLEALEPFAKAADDADGYNDVHPLGCDPCATLDGITVGSLRRARAAIAKAKGE